jgi:hypothetical protein
LNEHPEVFISNEIRLFVWVHKSLNVLTQEDEVVACERDRFVNYLRSVYPGLIRDFYRALRPQARYWGDKNPHYARPQHRGCLETVAALFPGARFIHLLRDGRDVVSSLVQKRHANGKPWTDFDTAHAVWKNHVDIGCTFGRGQLPGHYFEARYEELVKDDVGVARELFDYLGIEFHPQVERFCQRQREERTPLSGPTRDLSRGALDSDWAALLTPAEQVRSLELLGPYLVRYGYETASSLEHEQRRVALSAAQVSAP